LFTAGFGQLQPCYITEGFATFPIDATLDKYGEVGAVCLEGEIKEFPFNQSIFGGAGAGRPSVLLNYLGQQKYIEYILRKAQHYLPAGAEIRRNNEKFKLIFPTIMN